MTEEKKQPTPEEQRASNVKATLEYKVLQGSVGSNSIRLNEGDWGKFGANAAAAYYNKLMGSEAAQKEKNQLYNQRLEEFQEYSVYGEPVVTNQDLSLKFSKQLREVLQIATFGEIEKYSKDLGAKLKFRVPEEMKNLSYASIINSVVDKEKGIIDLNKLSDSNKEAFNFYNQVLSKVYERACSVNILKEADYFGDLNARALSLGDKYAIPKEDKKEAKK